MIDRRLEPESQGVAALAEAHARTVARFPRPHFDGAVLTWSDLAIGLDTTIDSALALSGIS